MTVASAPKVDALDQNEYELLDACDSKKADGEEARDKSKRGRARTAKVAPPVTYVCEHSGCNYSDDVFDRVAQCDPRRPLQEPRAPAPA